MKQEEYIKRYGKEAYQHRLKKKRVWYQLHKIQVAETNRKWERANPIRRLQLNLAWQKQNQQTIKAIKRKSYRKHIVKITIAAIKWKTENPEKRKIAYAKYEKSIKGRIVRGKANHKRWKLGFIPLNSPFKNAHGHHLNCELVVYIPKNLHTSVPHNVRTGKGIFKINDIALTFFQPILTGVEINEVAENEAAEEEQL